MVTKAVISKIPLHCYSSL